MQNYNLINNISVNCDIRIYVNENYCINANHELYSINSDLYILEMYNIKNINLILKLNKTYNITLKDKFLICNDIAFNDKKTIYTNEFHVIFFKNLKCRLISYNLHIFKFYILKNI